MNERKGKSGGGSLMRSEVVTIRMTPKLRYLVEIAARSQRRTVSNFIEWAIENSFKEVMIREGMDIMGEKPVFLAQKLGLLWHVHESSRLAYLALHYPWLLVHREQVLWQLVKASGLLKGIDREPENYSREESESHLDLEWIEDSVLPRLREHWETFNRVADGDLPEDSLPNWKEQD